MVVGLVLFARLGAGATFAALLPGFVLFGLGAGLMNVPLTNAVLDGAPAEQCGNRFGPAQRVPRSRRPARGDGGRRGAAGAAGRSRCARGASAPQAFLDGYHAGLWVTIGLLAAGVVVSYVSLRPRQRPEPGVLAVPGEEIEAEGVTANAP